MLRPTLSGHPNGLVKQYSGKVYPMRKAIFAALALIVSTSFNCAHAQTEVSRISANPSGQTFSIQFSGGRIISADDATQTFYVSKEDGTVVEVGFSEAIAQAEPDPGKRAALLSEFRSALADPISTGSITNSTTPRLAIDIWGSEEDPKCRTCQPQSTFPTVSDGADGAALASLELGSGWLGGPCDLGPCRPFRLDGGQIAYVGIGGAWGTVGGQGVSAQQYHADDYRRFMNARAGACGDARTQYLETATIGAATGAACLAFETGIGAVGCVAGVVSYAISWRKAQKLEKTCIATYPGPGGW